MIQALHGLVKGEPLIGFGQFRVYDSRFPPRVVGDQHFQQPFLADDSHINPHAGAATGTNSDENGAARFPFSDTMGLREAHYKAR